MTASMIAGILVLLVLSLALNIRQAFLWKGQFQAREAAVESAGRWKRQSDLWQSISEDEEQRWWTREGLSTFTIELKPRKMNDKPGLFVEVTTRQELRPLMLRFWFSREVEVDPQPHVQLDRNIVRTAHSEEFEATVYDEPPAKVQVSNGGRVDVRWDDPETLKPDSRFKLTVWPKSSGETLELLQVQRRYRVS